MELKSRDYPNLDRLGHMISTLGSTDFSSSFFRLVEDILPLDHCAAFAFSASGVPSQLVAEGSSAEAGTLARNLSEEYVRGAYAFDPVMRRLSCSNSTAPVIARLSTSSLADSAYRRRFYDEPQISEEVHIFATRGSLSYYACLFRNTSQPSFDVWELNAIGNLAGLALDALKRQSELRHTINTSAGFDSRPLTADRRIGLFNRMRSVLLADPARLSQREAEICAHIALGHTVEGVGLLLGISMNTVATHRKRAYAKLEICSQNELFARYAGVIHAPS